jgi:dipeptidase E
VSGALGFLQYDEWWNLGIEHFSSVSSAPLRATPLTSHDSRLTNHAYLWKFNLSLMQQRILAFSSSRTGNGGYLQSAAPVINQFLGNSEVTIAFVPFASVDGDYETYTNNVRAALPAQYHIVTVTHDNALAMIEDADAIMVGGGNTFKLLHDLYAAKALQLIQQKVNSGTPYIGWSAGSNITGATICTTNDMPIINPGSFDALGFFSFQINPHYYNITVPGFNGETRDQRLQEFLVLNPRVPIVALPEGTALLQDKSTLLLTGSTDAFVLQNVNGVLNKVTLVAGEEVRW